MTDEPRFLTVSEVTEIHDREIETAGGLAGTRDMKTLESAVAAPQASFGGEYVMDIFETAATYVNSIAMNHSFVDGNKRTALASALTFLFMNGYEVTESYNEELADRTLDLVTRRISKAQFTEHLRSRSAEIE